MNIVKASKDTNIGQIIKVDNVYYEIGENNTMSVTHSVVSQSENNLGDIVIHDQIEYNGKNYIVTLIVLSGTKSVYQSTAGWKKFQNIREYILGDVNIDGEVNNTDTNALVDYIMSEERKGIYKNLADLNNDGDKAILLTKCELCFNDKLVSSSNFKVTLSSGESRKCSYDNLASYSAKTGFSVVWHYTCNDESYTYRCVLSD